MTVIQERFIVVSNGETVGRITATSDGPVIDVDYAVDNNGRGAKLRERIRLDGQGIPLDWSIDGTSLMGGSVHEVLSTENGKTQWTSQADQGCVEADSPRLYVANDTSPYASGIYMRAVLASGRSLEVLPSGRLRAEHLRQVDLDGATVDAYVLSGVKLLPEFVLLGGEHRLIACLGGDLMISEIAVREGYEHHYATLVALGSALTTEHLARVQQRVRHRFDVPVRIRDVRVFDPFTKRLTERMSVTFFRGKITGVGHAAHPGQIEIDGQGGTVLAGLHDMHAHNSAWTGLFYLAAGVTTTRDMGNDNDMLLELLPRFDSGELAGPTVVPSGMIEGRSPFSVRLGIIPDTLDEALDAVRWYADRGYHQIKIYNSMNPDWVKPLTTEAHRLGLRAVGHVPAFATPDRMIEDGYDEITHINQLILGWLLEPDEDTRTPLRLTAMARAKDLDLSGPRVQHTVELMRQHDVGLDTTTVILERLMCGRAGQVHASEAAYLDHMPIGYQRYRKRTFVPAKSAEDLAAYDDSFPKLLHTMAMLHAEGIPLWPGTDDGTGFTVHRELELYVAVGMDPADVLRIATYDCAEHLGRADVSGSIERGKRADFVLVDGDPTQNINDIRKVRMVVKGGDVHFPAEIYRELDIEPFELPPPVTIPGADS
ncbi:hypothetical protein JOF56_009627 [Kibdelosporangium banguiense]|uniref:Amidohydrolase-related domain-containing protein n=1 Tax=Kibdelosporangium banguiense TaxID=1365924 RepID=A0ABS4TXY9_9PSEU|nr:amidohydrolase family protein [Kibdelosporangium banguiense]MBP2329242.1 hypothetical protein [Kibdelosporangium banguiense]